ncbi:DUF998 domain-containing protein [Leifsonia sp. ZF2019]|uniref:DUF998 domain-containing protein n=1 Tax=Leifsonia sp. ZF2019 TaxID=2781978 RepID=UPI001CC00A3B|nr:DUF998 domain-containing protein [Leifsonia sp. ZF2019]UAJ80097.1 DUF998 domain-containing protein [Leifsonia sp. ZF2019]
MLLVVGAAAVLAGLTIIWVARLTVTRSVYVSQLGAEGAPTAAMFRVALLLIAAGGFLIALASIDVRSRVRVLDCWAPALSLGFAALCFLIASQVTCTAHCPVPIVDPRSTYQDLAHTVAAVLGFTAACFAMLQVAFIDRSAWLARYSFVSCLAVALITIGGGVLAILQVATTAGAWMELIGTTVAIIWIAVYSLTLACSPMHARVVSVEWAASTDG